MRAFWFSHWLCAVLTGIAFGLAPSAAIREQAAALIIEGRRARIIGRGSRGKFRSLLVVAELGIALVLMTGDGLLMESFAHLVRVDTGFAPKNLMTFPINLPRRSLPQAQQQAQFYRQVLERVKTLPYVR